MTMLSMLIVALVVWAGVFGFTWLLDRKVAALEKRIEALRAPEKR